MSDEPAGGAPHDLTHDLTQEAAVHLRAAALELITAARAVLDLTEQLVKDPGPIAAAVAALAAAAGRPMPPPARTAAAGEDDVAGSAADTGSADQPPAVGAARVRPRPRVQHIRVS